MSNASEIFSNLEQNGVRVAALVDKNGFTLETKDFPPHHGYKVKVISDLAKNLASCLEDEFQSVSIMTTGDKSHLIVGLENDLNLYVHK